MKVSKAVNIAVSCVMGSALDKETKQEVIDTVRRLETSLGEISDILEGENVTPLVEQLAYVLTYSGIYNKD